VDTLNQMARIGQENCGYTEIEESSRLFKGRMIDDVDTARRNFRTITKPEAAE